MAFDEAYGPHSELSDGSGFCSTGILVTGRRRAGSEASRGGVGQRRFETGGKSVYPCSSESLGLFREGVSMTSERGGFRVGSR